MTTNGTTTITRRNVLKTTGATAAGTVGLIGFTGTVAANCPCADDGGSCELLGKIEDTDDLQVGDQFEFTYQGTTVVVEITSVDYKQGSTEASSVNIKTMTEDVLCRVKVKGGPDLNDYACDTDPGHFSYDSDNCESFAKNLESPKNPKNGKPYGISHLTLYICDFNGDGTGDGGNCNPPSDE